MDPAWVYWFGGVSAALVLVYVLVTIFNAWNYD